MRCLFAKGRQAKEEMVFYLTDQSGKVSRAAVMAQLSVIVGLARVLSSVPSTPLACSQLPGTLVQGIGPFSGLQRPPHARGMHTQEQINS